MTIEPIPFAGLVEVDLDLVIEGMYGKNPENMPKYVVLGDGSLYIFHKEEDRYALCDQTPPLQEGIPAAEGARGAASPQCEGKSPLCDGQEGHKQDRQGY